MLYFHVSPILCIFSLTKFKNWSDPASASESSNEKRYVDFVTLNDGEHGSYLTKY